MMNQLFENPQNRNNLALGLIGLGVFFFINQIFNFVNIGGMMWPFFVIVPGGIFLYLALTGDKTKTGFIFPGLIITGTGVILLYQSLTGHWESWAYIWSLYPGMVGLGLRFNGERTAKPKEIETGREMLRWSLIAFAAFFFLFEVIIFGGLTSWLPVVLIGAGAILLMSQKKGEKAKRKNEMIL